MDRYYEAIKRLQSQDPFCLRRLLLMVACFSANSRPSPSSPGGPVQRNADAIVMWGTHTRIGGQKVPRKFSSTTSLMFKLYYDVMLRLVSTK